MGGRGFIDLVLPIIIFAISDSIGPNNSLPHISVEVLVRSAFDLARGKVGGDLSNMWDTDIGIMLWKLVFSPHFRELCGVDGSEKDGSVPKHPNSRCSSMNFLDMCVEYEFKWRDVNQRLDSSTGICNVFEDARDTAIMHISLAKQLDNFVKFLSVIEHYKRLSNVAGDVAMYYLRTSLQHLLLELELTIGQVDQLASCMMEEVMRTVTSIKLNRLPTHGMGRTNLWIKRLQHIDMRALKASHTAFIEAVQALRFLTVEARLPQIQDTFLDSIKEVSELSVALEFSSRCAVPPPLPLSVMNHSFENKDENQTTPSCVSLSASAKPLPEVHEAEFPPVALSSPVVLHPSVTTSDNSTPLHPGVWQNPSLSAACPSAPSETNASVTMSAPSEITASTHMPEEPPPFRSSGRSSTVTDQRPVTPEEENRFYDSLYGLLVPLFVGQYLPDEQTSGLLLRAKDVSFETLQWIKSTEKQVDSQAALCRMCRLVVHAQVHCSDLEQLRRARGVNPNSLPRLNGINWTGKKLQVTDPVFGLVM